ncbi:hypothetical protein [Ruminococcus flavefaciens]|uniref:hypothetical protein n=1 Tax=Ruminococcus flavefaciens TaxID=1265 RepID=UPI0026ED0E12|nr:hypothetical protein [Ruminococcus flavefaciens]
MTQLLKKICIFLVFILPLMIVLLFVLGATDRKCYHFVEDFVEKANLYSLTDYIDYSMLNKEIKEYVLEEDLNITSDEDILALSNKIKKMNEDSPSKSGKYSTADFRHSAFWAEIKTKTVVYHIYFEFEFSPQLFHNPELRNITVKIVEISPSNQ